jgi:hypothetical protein
VRIDEFVVYDVEVGILERPTRFPREPLVIAG